MKLNTVRNKSWMGMTLAAVLFLPLLAGCTAADNNPAPVDPPLPTGTYAGPTPQEPLKASSIALITDYGNCDDGQAAVASMVGSWNPLAVVTAGDNTQNVKDCLPYKDSVDPYYGKWFSGTDGPRFFPVLGNHDYTNAGAGLDAYNVAFKFLSTKDDADRRWYDVRVGDVHFFMVDSEATGDDVTLQQQWLKTALVEAQNSPTDARWRVVVFHRPAFSSGTHGPRVEMQPAEGWDYKGWGADMVIAGHQHIYEDVVVDDFHYLTAGVGATGTVRPCPADDARVEGSRICIDGPGALRIVATGEKLVLEYHQSKDGVDTMTDTFSISG